MSFAALILALIAIVILLEVSYNIKVLNNNLIELIKWLNARKEEKL